jgi:ABC-2 type transport system ATP-binding protein
MTTKSDNAIVVKNLQKSFKKLEVLRGITFAVPRGSILAVLGPNGAGKTTTIRILSTLLLPDGGQAKINGFDVVQQSDDVRASIGLTGQYAAVDEYLTGRENLQMMGRLYRLSKADTAQRATDLLEQFDLVEASVRPVRTYSGGMRRRLDLAMSLIASPPIIFLDEPTTGLDPRSRMTIWRMIKQLAKSGTTILLTTQYMEEADQLADKIVVIDNGKVIAEGTAAELKRRIGSDRLEITIGASSSFDKAKKIIDGEALQVDEDRRTVSIATRGGVAELKQILQKLEEARVAVESISLHSPTLDDVFLTLTGRKTVQTADDTQGKKEKKRG